MLFKWDISILVITTINQQQPPLHPPPHNTYTHTHIERLTLGEISERVSETFCKNTRASSYTRNPKIDEREVESINTMDGGDGQLY